MSAIFERIKQTHRHLIPVEGLLLGEGVEALSEGALSWPGRDAEAEVPEGLEGDGLVAAVAAHQRGLQLAHEQVHQVRVVTPDVPLPRLHRLLAHTKYKKYFLKRRIYFSVYKYL